MKLMKAIVLRETGNYRSLKPEDVEFPVLSGTEALVRMKASALNHRDLWIVKGLYADIKLPVILGSDGAGIVHSVGNEMHQAWVGRAVVINPGLYWGENERVQQPAFRILGMPDNGTFAEYVAVPVINLYPKPEHLSWEEAAALPLAGLTAYRALFTQGRLLPGETVLITGIGGGVATMAMLMAVQAGARVIVTSGSDEKIERSLTLGAHAGVNHNHPDLRKHIQQAALPFGGIDLIVDGAGGKLFEIGIDAVKPGGRIVNYGVTAGKPEQLDLRKIFWKQITLQGSTMGRPAEFERMCALIQSRKIRPVVDQVFTPSDIARAFEKMDQGLQQGKLTIKWEGK